LGCIHRRLSSHILRKASPCWGQRVLRDCTVRTCCGDGGDFDLVFGCSFVFFLSFCRSARFFILLCLLRFAFLIFRFLSLLCGLAIAMEFLFFARFCDRLLCTIFLRLALVVVIFCGFFFWLFSVFFLFLFFCRFFLFFFFFVFV